MEPLLPISALLAVLPFVFSLAVLSVVRKTEMYCREPWAWVLTAFTYGSTLAVFLSIILSEGASIFIGLFTLPPIIFALATAAIVAPIVEEGAKATGILSSRPRLTEVENGIIYGSAIGLGFSATENVIYFISAYYSAGVEVLISTIILRFLTSTFLHLGASGVAGYGIGIANVRKLAGMKPVRWTPFLLAAICLHAFFNFLSYIPSLLGGPYNTEITVGILFVEMAMVWLVFAALRRKIKTLDRTSGCSVGSQIPSTNGSANVP